MTGDCLRITWLLDYSVFVYYSAAADRMGAAELERHTRSGRASRGDSVAGAGYSIPRLEPKAAFSRSTGRSYNIKMEVSEQTTLRFRARRAAADVLPIRLSVFSNVHGKTFRLFKRIPIQPPRAQ